VINDNYQVYKTSNHEAFYELNCVLRSLIACQISSNEKYNIDLDYGTIREDAKFKIYDC